MFGTLVQAARSSLHVHISVAHAGGVHPTAVMMETPLPSTMRIHGLGYALLLRVDSLPERVATDTSCERIRCWDLGFRRELPDEIQSSRFKIISWLYLADGCRDSLLFPAAHLRPTIPLTQPPCVL